MQELLYYGYTKEAVPFALHRRARAESPGMGLSRRSEAIKEKLPKLSATQSYDQLCWDANAVKDWQLPGTDEIRHVVTSHLNGNTRGLFSLLTLPTGRSRSFHEASNGYLCSQVNLLYVCRPSKAGLVVLARGLAWVGTFSGLSLCVCVCACTRLLAVSELSAEGTAGGDVAASCSASPDAQDLKVMEGPVASKN